MFERLFIPFILDREVEGLRDPIDQCMLYYFQKFKEVSMVACDAIHSAS